MKVIITCPCLDKPSGIENYIIKLINILFKLENIQIFVFPIFSYEKSKITDFFLDKRINILENNFPMQYIGKNHKKSAKIFQKYCEKYNFDLIIDNTGILPIPKRILMNQNYFLVQHFDVKHFLYKINTISGFIKRIWWFFSSYPIKFYYAKNIVVFTELDEEKIRKYVKNPKQNFYKIPLSSFSEKEIIKQKNKIKENLKNKKNDLFYMGRIVKKYKRFHWAIPLIKMATKNNWKIKIYGSGSYVKKIEKITKDKIVTIPLNDENQKIQEYSKSLFSFLFSPYEGFPYSVVESLSSGTPVIIRHKFNNSNYFEPALKIKTISKNVFSKKTNRLINFYKNNIDEYYNLCLLSINFALKNLTVESFEKKWNKIFALIK